MWGVKINDPAVLACFCGICGALLGLCSMAVMMTLLACAFYCLSTLIFNTFLVIVFGAGLRSATVLRQKASEGVSLTAQPPSDSVAPSRIGAEVPPQVIETVATKHKVAKE